MLCLSNCPAYFASLAWYVALWLMHQLGLVCIGHFCEWPGPLTDLPGFSLTLQMTIGHFPMLLQLPQLSLSHQLTFLVILCWAARNYSALGRLVPRLRCVTNDLYIIYNIWLNVSLHLFSWIRSYAITLIGLRKRLVELQMSNPRSML